MNKKRLLAILLSVAMMVTSMPIMVLAETVQDEAANEQVEQTIGSDEQVVEEQQAEEQAEEGEELQGLAKDSQVEESAVNEPTEKAPVVGAATPPTGATGLVYNGNKQNLISSKGGYKYFRVGLVGSWSDSIPTATDAGNHTVYYRNKTSGFADGNITVNIEQATISEVVLSDPTTFDFDGGEKTVSVAKVYAGSGSNKVEVPKEVTIAKIGNITYWTASGLTASAIGKYKVTVTAEKHTVINDNFKGSAQSDEWEIVQPSFYVVDSSTSAQYDDNKSYTYNKSVQIPSIKVYNKQGGTLLTEGVDYELVWQDLGGGKTSQTATNANADGEKYNLTIKGKAGSTYAGATEKTIYWKINKVALPTTTVSKVSGLKYTGKAQELVSFSDELKNLIKDGEVDVYFKQSGSESEKKVSYDKEKGTFSNVPTGIEVKYDEYTGLIKAYYHVYFRIDGKTNYNSQGYKRNILDTKDVENYQVDISKADPTVTIEGNTGLVYNKDSQQLLSKAIAHFGDETLSEAKRPKVLLNYKKEGETTWALSEWTSDITKIVGKDAGNYVVGYKAEADNNGYGNWNAVSEKTLTVNIAPKDISTSLDITATALNMPWTGEEVQTTVTVKDGETKLAEGEDKDYTLSGDKATDVGEHTVTITGKGNYTGTKEVTWKVLDIKISLSETEFTYDTKEHSVTETVAKQDGTPITDYEVVAGSVMKATNAGTYTVQVKCTGEYADIGTVTLTWEIKPAELVEGDVKLSQEFFVWWPDTERKVTATYTHTFEDGTQVTLGEDDFDLVEGSLFTNLDEKGRYNAGEYFVGIKGTGNYTGEVKAEWFVQGVPLDFIATALQQRTFTYDGTEKAPQVNVGALGLLTEGEDYEITGDLKATAAGEYTIYVTGKGKYYGTKELTWKIEGKQMSECMILVENPSYLDIGVEREPSITVYDINDMSSLTDDQKTLLKKLADGSTILDSSSVKIAKLILNGLVSLNPTDNKMLTAETDYTLDGTFKASKKGAYTISVTGINNYAGTVDKEWIIGDSIKNDLLYVSSTHVYDGTVQTPTLDTRNPLAPYKEGNYTVQIRNEDGTLSSDLGRTDAGTYTLVVKGVAEKDKYGTVELTWTIAPKEVQLEWTGTETVYDGTVQRPVLKTKDGYGFVQSDLDNGNVKVETAKAISLVAPKNAGTYIMYSRIEFADGFNTGNYKIAQSEIEIAGNQIGEKIYDWFINATSRLDSFTEGKIKETLDALIGMAKQNRYFTTEFVIKKRPVGVDWSNTEFTYDGHQHKPTATPTNVVAGDYCRLEVEGAQTNAGTYTATVSELSFITGLIGNYELDESEKTCEFTIKPMDIGAKSIEAYQKLTENLIYNAETQQPTVVVRDCRSILSAIYPLEEGTDFEVVKEEGSEYEAVNAGKYTLTVAGIGNYGGTTTVKWEISPRSLRDEDVTVKFEEDSFVYNGKVQEPTLVVEYKGKVVYKEGLLGDTAGNLEEGTDYTVTGTRKAKDVRSYRVRVSGINNFTDAVRRGWEIVPLDLSKLTDEDEVIVRFRHKTFNGSEQMPELRRVIINGNRIDLREIGMSEDSAARNAGENDGTMIGNVKRNRFGRYNIIGEYAVKWTMDPKVADEETFDITAPDYTYNGKDQKVDLTIIDKDYDGKLVEGVDYELEDAVKKEVGQYTVTIHFIGNYEGTPDMTKTWRIVPAPKTGDMNNMLPWIILAIVSVIALAGLCIKRRKDAK